MFHVFPWKLYILLSLEIFLFESVLPIMYQTFINNYVSQTLFGDLLFLLRFLLLYYYYYQGVLSLRHERVHGRSQELHFMKLGGIIDICF